MVEAIDSAFAANLDGLTWMDAGTKRPRPSRFRSWTNKIGYPDKWRDYAS